MKIFVPTLITAHFFSHQNLYDLEIFDIDKNFVFSIRKYYSDEKYGKSSSKDKVKRLICGLIFVR